ncbi:DNA polymerase III, delta subunit [Abditibacterium utsteinense]|uniref:DNA polymerase III, delta subunit n=1 Tax=Abditibacterium utsteinense TaxID=1960156 RepID=A0A2S8SRF1_9BACT|nr:hypothetical protein [Abditibacterium utsteinense]PQV63356.1 DNA polymerase III, delta subunit [Abditibacterium utsteinense]
MKPLIGHASRFDGLSRAFAKGQIPQTLLISGPPNIGKSTFVLRYAQLLLCPNLVQENGLPAPCGVCKTCHQVEIEVFPDFRVFRPIISKAEPTRAPEALDSSLIPVEMARSFNEEAIRKPLASARKVLWMHQFEKTQEEAQNAMLKTLEEPPPGTFLVLTTENAKNLRDTILSRCWHLPLPPVADMEIENWLRAEFSSVPPQKMKEVLRAAAGRPGAARRELERMENSDGAARSRFAVTCDILGRLDTSSPVAALGFTEEALSWANLWWAEDAGAGVDLKKLGAKGPRAAAARFLDELMIAGRALWMKNLAEQTSNHARNGHADGEANLNSPAEVGAARLDQIRKTRHYIYHNANRQLALDVMFGRLIALRPRAVSSSTRGRN